MAKAQAQEKHAPEVPSAEDLEFERELRARHPKRTIKRFAFPAQVTDARAVYVIEMTSRDSVRAAEMADSLMTDVERKSGQLVIDAERRESVRLSLIGVVTSTGAHSFIDGSKPFMEIDDWSSKAWACLYNFHHDANGIPVDEVKKAVASARTLGVAALAATQADAERTR